MLDVIFTCTHFGYETMLLHWLQGEFRASHTISFIPHTWHNPRSYCFACTHFRYETMFLCWLESPAERPTFTTLVKCLCEMIKRLQDQTPYYNLPDGTVPSLTNDTSVWSTVWLLAWSSVLTVFMLKHSYTRNAFTIGNNTTCILQVSQSHGYVT